MEKKTYTAIVLAAGKGTRMGGDVHKQYLLLNGKPVLYYSLKALEDSRVDHIVLVTGESEIDYCQKEIIEKYGFRKVKKVVAGGAERYHSVFCGLQAAEDADYVLIHDGARPFVENAILERCMEAVEKYQACVVGMPVKDTIKIVDEQGFAVNTPPRNLVWNVQTPQCFFYPLILDAYSKMIEEEKHGKQMSVTDDAMVLETFSQHQVKLIEGSYENIKITTPEDLLVAEIFCKQRQ